MKRTSALLPLIFYLFCSFLAAASIHLIFQAKGFTIFSHSFRFLSLPLILMTSLLFLLLWGLRQPASAFLARHSGIELSLAFRKDTISYLPILFLALLPLACLHYIEGNDFRARITLFALSVFLGVIYLKGTAFLGSDSPVKSSLQNIWAKTEAVPLKTKLIFLFILALLLFNIGSALMISGGITFSGDEPHYLLIAHSLIKDGDFKLSNNYAQKDYAAYMPDDVVLDKHLAPGTQGYSFHSPGIPILLLPFYALGSLFNEVFMLFFIRFGMSIFGALLGVQLFLYSLQEWKKEKLALFLWFIFIATTPVFFHSIHVYPEIILAFFALTAFRLLRFSSHLSPSRLIVIGTLLGLFLWLHAVKYVFISVPFFLYSLWILFRVKRVGWNFFFFLTPLLLLTLIHMFFSSILYGSLSPFSVSLQGVTSGAESLSMIKEFLSGVDFRYRWETFLGYLFDQRDGLLFYAPVYAFSFLGMIELGKKDWRKLLILVFLSAPYVAGQAILTQRGAYAPQARTQAAVFWVMALFLGSFLACNRKRIFHYLLLAALGFSQLATAVLLKNPWSLYQPTTYGTVQRAGELFNHLSNLHFYLPQYLPSYLKMDNREWLPNTIWLGVFVLFCVSYVLVRKHSFRIGFGGHAILVSALLLAVFLLGVLYPQFILGPPTNVTFPSGVKLTFYGLGRVLRMPSPGKFQLPRDLRSYGFYFTSWRPLEKFRVDFGSPDGEFDVEIKFFDRVIFDGKTKRETAFLELPAEASYRYKGRFLYSFSIDLKKEEGQIAYTHPFLFSLQPD